MFILNPLNYMNIFILDTDQKASSKMLCDKHVIKIPTETCQILCNVHHMIQKKRNDIPYKPYNMNNDMVKWASESLSNYNWLLKTLYYQLREYTYRYGQYHKSTNIYEWLCDNKPLIIDTGITQLPNNIPDKYINQNIIDSYREYYKNEYSSILKYTKRKIPTWLK